MRAAYLPAAIPIAAFLIGPFFLNRTVPFILGMPLLLGFIAVSVVATSLVMAGIYCLDSRSTAEADDERTGSTP